MLTQGTVVLLLKSNGWPQVPMRSFGSNTAFVISGSAILIYNLPDLISLATYFAIWKHFNNASVSPVPYEPAFGGIWVGEVIDEPAPTPMVAHETDDNEHKMEAVLKALQWHMKFCLLDLIFPFLTVFGCNTIAIYFIYPMQILCFYWVPFLVIKYGFKQLNGVAKHIAKLAVCRSATNMVSPHI